MGIFVRLYAVQMLVCRARMVQFVKVHAVHIRSVFRHGIRFVKQRLRLAFRMRGYYVPVRIKHGNFIEPNGAARHAQRDMAALQAAAYALPAEHIAVYLVIGNAVAFIVR